MRYVRLATLFLFIGSLLLYDVDHIAQHSVSAPLSVAETNIEIEKPEPDCHKCGLENAVITSGESNENKKTSSGDKTDSYDPRRDVLYRTYLFFTIAGVFGGIAGLGILIWQTVLVRISSRAAQKAAGLPLSMRKL
jgi:hypothetical protein